jgi:Cof subfamily protein (haloacid dehalogenase superfamily)
LSNEQKSSPKGLFITDFDGTLLGSDGTVAQRDLDALAKLSRHGVKTAIATGRSLHSFMDSPGADLAVDYIIFTTGAGVVSKPEYELLYQVNLSADMVTDTLERMSDSSLDFMLHHPVPDNHRFLYRRVTENNTDFESRIERQSGVGQALEATHMNGFGEAAQFLAVVPPENSREVLERLRNEFSALSVVRATSPIDHESSWIELFHPDVSKGKTAAWLIAELGIDHGNTMAVGNDYNDLDLLEWAAHSFVVENAPHDMKCQFETVCSNDDGGVAEAVEWWLLV